ncbi:hypothetical protein OG897_08080 [Streptomyces sp. NBC_00237]|uniref:hypothetical protein n=1 Tax=Streptomyces sp. NBC_00237 TaxID=2975687 RepID=UPI0022551AD5|nr:hypothetical protein [Streptomyces sp. NBC_00237]MCX5201409.1 hypothetical protein [Streptomyces sp. NBC_00237]
MGAWLSAALVAPLVLTAGCAARQPDPRGERAPEVPAPSAEVLGLRLPTDAYLLSVDEIYDGEEAADLLTRQCMRERGFEWRLIDRPDFGDWRNRRRYGVIEPDVAKSFGYHHVPALLSPTEVYEEKHRRELALTPQEKKAATDEASGCQRRANDTLWRGIRYDDALAMRFSSKALAESAKDPRVLRAVRDWSACMRGGGHSYPTHAKAIGDARWDMAKPPSREEKAVAVQDVTCQERTGLVRTWFRVDSELQQKWIAAKPKEFQALRAAKRSFLERAEKVRENPGG